MTRHHAIPSSRCKTNGGKHGRANILRVPHGIHDAWHQMFVNMTPIEVIAWIVRHKAEEGYFTDVHIVAEWEDAHYEFVHSSDHRINAERKGRYKPVCWRKVFGQNRSLHDAVVLILESWCPKEGYIISARVTSKPEPGTQVSYTFPSD